MKGVVRTVRYVSSLGGTWVWYRHVCEGICTAPLTTLTPHSSDPTASPASPFVTRSHTLTHARTRSHTLTRVHTRSHTLTHAHALTRAQTRSRAHALTHAHTRSHALTRAHTRSHTLTHAHSSTRLAVIAHEAAKSGDGSGSADGGELEAIAENKESPLEVRPLRDFR